MSIRPLSRRERFLYGLSGLVGLIALWQLLSSTGVLDPLIFSSPKDVVNSARDLYQQGKLMPALGSTGALLAISMAISSAVGLLLGVILGWYKRIDALLDPWVSLFYAMPRIALLPVIIAYSGIGLESRVIVVVLIAMPPILINTAAGVASVERDHLRLARSYLATNIDVLRTIALPGAVPMVVAGLRQGMIQGLLGVVVAEYFVGTTGIGGIIFSAGITLNTGDAFVGAIILGIAAIVFSSGLRAVEHRLDRWRA